MVRSAQMMKQARHPPAWPDLSHTTFQECRKKTLWTRFPFWTVQNDFRNFMALDIDTTLAEIGIPLVKQILAMQWGRCRSSLPVLAQHPELTFAMHAVSSMKLPSWASHNSFTARGVPCLSRLRDCSVL